MLYTWHSQEAWERLPLVPVTCLPTSRKRHWISTFCICSWLMNQIRIFKYTEFYLLTRWKHCDVRLLLRTVYLSQLIWQVHKEYCKIQLSKRAQNEVAIIEHHVLFWGIFWFVCFILISYYSGVEIFLKSNRPCIPWKLNRKIYNLYFPWFMGGLRAIIGLLEIRINLDWPQ